MTDKLTEICDTKRTEVAARKAVVAVSELAAHASRQSAPRGFEAALQSKPRHHRNAVSYGRSWWI